MIKMKCITLVVCLTSALLTNCSHKTLQVKALEEKANYRPSPVPSLQLLAKQDGPYKLGPKRVGAQEKVCWYHPHEMPSQDYFLGGWIKLVYEDEHWEPETTPQRPSDTKEFIRPFMKSVD